MVGTMIASEVPTQSCMRTVVGHAEHAEHLVEHRHDDRAAADAEQAGEQSGDDAADDDGQREPEQLARTERRESFLLPLARSD